MNGTSTSEPIRRRAELRRWSLAAGSLIHVVVGLGVWAPLGTASTATGHQHLARVNR